MGRGREFVSAISMCCGFAWCREGAWKSILLLYRLGVSFTVRVEQFLPAIRPVAFHLRRGNVPIRPAFLRDSAKILTQILHRGPSKKPVPVVDFVDHEVRL